MKVMERTGSQEDFMEEAGRARAGPSRWILGVEAGGAKAGPSGWIMGVEAGGAKAGQSG